VDDPYADGMGGQRDRGTEDVIGGVRSSSICQLTAPMSTPANAGLGRRCPTRQADRPQNDAAPIASRQSSLHGATRPGGVPRVGQMLGHLIRRAQQRHTQYWTELLDGDLTGPQYAILSAVHAHPQIDQQAAAELASLDRSTAADVISRLERNGWLHRDRDPTDARRAVLALTAPSRTALGPVTERVSQVQERLLGSLAIAERRDLVRLLGRVAYRGDPPRQTPGMVLPGVLALSTTPGHLIRRTEQIHQKLWSSNVPPPTTPSQYAVLCVLALGPLDQVSVGALASLDRSSTADILARLSRRGLITMERDRVDRRRRYSCLTKNAQKLLRGMTPNVLHVQKELAAPLSQRDARRLLKLLSKVAYE
jgi:MarR family transcriptional regulator, lower aerobic nicotinate degradation pathway regulator